MIFSILGAKRASSIFSILGISRIEKCNKTLYRLQSKVQLQVRILLPVFLRVFQLISIVQQHKQFIINMFGLHKIYRIDFIF